MKKRAQEAAQMCSEVQSENETLKKRVNSVNGQLEKVTESLQRAQAEVRDAQSKQVRVESKDERRK